ncbi:MAG: ABC transporter permease [Desulfamplus sp.]|nr:ABC transporter permease [Desulfamplus sp.]
MISLGTFFRYRASDIRFELLGILILLLLWFVAGWIFLLVPSISSGDIFLPFPTFKALYKLLLQERFYLSVWASMSRVFIGILIAAFIGIPLGLVTGYYPILRNIAYAPIQFLRMISPLAWMPIALIIFTDFESAIYFLIVMATVWPIILNTASGAANVNPSWIKMAMNQGASHFQIFYTIIIPASLPGIMASLRLALGVAWIVLVPAEFLGVASGLGYLINDARDTMAYDTLMAIIVAIGILGFTLDKIFQIIQSAFTKSWIE